MQLHQLKKNPANKPPRTRVGRGGKRGTTSGKGTKGQRSRSGHRIRPAERDFIQRLPKLRGFKNKPYSEPLIPINLGRLMNLKGLSVTPASLRSEGIVRRNGVIKILGGGEVTKKLVFSGVKVSASARKKIEAAGGSIKN
jgi:ribosomal protein L15, bacterial/organelle